MALTTVDGGLLSSTNAQYTGFKNRIINGAMGIWQRGTSFTDPTITNFYTADRWGVNRNSDATGATVSQSTDVPTGFKYSLKLQRTAANTSTASLYLYNSNESINTLDLAGQSVTLSFYIKTGANYSGGTLAVQGYYGTGTDQRVYSYTGATAFINTTQTITSTWTRYTFTGSVGSTSTEVGFQVYWTPTGTAGADDSVYITGVQLEKGSTATSFDYRPYGTELALCQRYLPVVTINTDFNYIGQAYSTTAAAYIVPFQVQSRVSATGILASGTIVALNSVGSISAGGTLGFRASTTDHAVVSITSATGLVAGNATSLAASSVTQTIQFTGCEL